MTIVLAAWVMAWDNYHMNASQKAGALVALNLMNCALTEALSSSGGRRPKTVTEKLFAAMELMEDARRELQNTNVSE